MVISLMMRNLMLGLFLIWLSVLKITECQMCKIKIDDQLWQKQWYLGGKQNEYSMNVMPAWQNCANGTGVTVGVVDNGIQNHRDLNIDRFLNAGYNWNSQSSNKQTDYLLRLNEAIQWLIKKSPNNDLYKRNYLHRNEESLRHGTRVAGIIAAKKNHIGIIGIAFGAHIADIKIASTAGFKSFDAALLVHRSDIIDVYSCSFANFHTGTKTYHLLENQEKALSEGTKYGRRNLGSVYVFATGNSGGSNTDIFRDSCAYDRLVTNRYVISVAGIQHNLKAIPNGEACSAMMVAAFTARPGSRSTLITTDIHDRFTEHFSQNSAAVPMVSGAVALALSANPNLTYRDMMHLLVQTSRSDLTSDFRKKFTKNAAGLFVSSYFGFGLLDIGHLVNRSKTWENVPNRVSCHKDVHFNTSLHSNAFTVQINSCRATYIEHVEVSLKVNHKNAGQIQWVLISPFGTSSTILPGRALDQTEKMDLTVLTVQMWGENPNGYWRLEPAPVFKKTLDHGIVESVGITVHGYTCTGQQCLYPAQQEIGYWGQWSGWEQCTATCGQGTKRRFKQCKGNSRSRYCIGKNDITEACFLRQCQLNKQTANSCPKPHNLLSVCVEQCADDTDCKNRKCCYNGCGHTCSNPGTSNSCPKPHNLLSVCVEQCADDADCNNRKCCYNGCGHTCENPGTCLSGREC